jgi:transposase
VVPPEDDHDCGWKAYAQAQAQELHLLKERLAALEKRAYGKKSERQKAEKLPPAVPQEPRPRAEQKAARDALAKLRATKLETTTTPITVGPEARHCDDCGSTALREVGEGKPSTVIEYVPGYFRKQVYLRQTLACACGKVITAAPPARMGDKTRYAPSFVAHLCVSKCCDSIPQYRLEKEYARLGIPIKRSTLNSLIHRAATELAPLYSAACALVARAGVVHADETTMRQADLDKKAFMWTFSSPELVVYKYAESRSGEVASEMLGDSQGTIIVDQYTGYNQVTQPGRRTRAGCMAHARRKIFESREHAGFDGALQLTRKLYEIEDRAKSAKIVGTDEHLKLRVAESRPVFARLLLWARRAAKGHEPRSAAGRAARYVLKGRKALRVFLTDAKVAIDNNAAERDLRRVALGRKNYLFFQSKESGERHAILYSLVASAEKHGLNPTAYLADVLVRIHTHPQSQIEELLPHKYRPPNPSVSG